MSTDTAFALGVLALVAPGATRLRVRLLTLVVIDDLVALLVIATVYTEEVDVVALVVAARAVLPAAGAALRAGGMARAGRRAPRRRRLGRAPRVGHRPADRRAGGRARHQRLSAGAHGPRARDRADALLPRAAHARARPLGPARSDVRDLRQRAAPVPPASLDELRDRAAVRARERRHPHRRGSCSATRSRRPITLGICSGTWSASRPGSSPRRWLGTRRWVTGLRPSLSWP